LRRRIKAKASKPEPINIEVIGSGTADAVIDADSLDENVPVLLKIVSTCWYGVLNWVVNEKFTVSNCPVERRSASPTPVIVADELPVAVEPLPVIVPFRNVTEDPGRVHVCPDAGPAEQPARVPAPAWSDVRKSSMSGTSSAGDELNITNGRGLGTVVPPTGAFVLFRFVTVKPFVSFA